VSSNLTASATSAYERRFFFAFSPMKGRLN
jgi:hypothetical protein